MRKGFPVAGGREGRRHRARGFTLVEVSIAVGLMSLLFIAALTLFVSSIQLAIAANAQTASSGDASVALQRVLADTRHAFWVGLPDDTKGQWTPPPGTTNGSFTVSLAGVTRDTAVEIVFPNTAAATVKDGTNTTTTDAAADRTSTASPPANTLWIFRADLDGTPDALSGTCLWERGSERGAAVDRAFLKSLSATAPDAVRFERPADAGTPASLLPYLLRIKIVSAYYSPMKGVQTSESGDGTQVTPLSGQTALMRDHEPNLDHEPGSTPSTAVAAPWYSN